MHDVSQAYQPRNRPVVGPLRSETAVAFNLREQSIYNDIRVRKAMQMAIDLETINDTYFMGLAKTRPQGIVGDGMKGFTSPLRSGLERSKGLYVRLGRGRGVAR